MLNPKLRINNEIANRWPSILFDMLVVWFVVKAIFKYLVFSDPIVFAASAMAAFTVFIHRIDSIRRLIYIEEVTEYEQYAKDD